MKREKKKALKRWLTVDLLIPSDFSEPVSNFLMEQGGTGIEEIAENPQRTRLKTYFLEAGRKGQVLRMLHRYLKSLERLYPGRFSCRVETSTTPEKDWGEKWKQFFKPVRVTPRIMVKPPWSRVRLGRGEILVEINPGVAFGTGTHATTKLCIQALEHSLRRRGLSVLDVGTGSGILSIVAAKLGAKEVRGVDPDGASVDNARENVSRNRVSTCVRIRRGTVGDTRNTFDIVVANIDLRVLRKMRWPLVRRVKPGGLLILSGLLERERERIRQHYMETGLLVRPGGAQMEEWVCLMFRRKR
ncbi:MAG: ribosomal protein methyltransferase [Deltaproteobacteria bacterium]|nr:ribosomal protein methyltransferase [Deltaproteobacteria bacterium]